jgi:translocation and assembly module TamB
VQRFELKPAPSEQLASGSPLNVVLRNEGPVSVQIADGTARIELLRLTGRDTNFVVAGTLPFQADKQVNLKVNGTLDLAALRSLSSVTTITGQSTIDASLAGTLSSPKLAGLVHVHNAAISAANIPNGLSDVNGTIIFDNDRATLQQLTGHTGGGNVSVSGFVNFGHGPWLYRLEAAVDQARFRYGGGVSVTLDSRLNWTGTSSSSLISGTASISRAVISANTEVGNLLAAMAVPPAAGADSSGILAGLHFDVHVQSAPNLELSTALGRDIEGDIDLRLRGTPERPVLLGSITADQGDVKVFGTKYTLNRGDISFTNPVKIDPVLNLDLQTQARGIIVDVTLTGTLSRLNVNYRSDPPLQPREIIALLTVGRTPTLAANVPSSQAANEITALQTNTTGVIGQALTPSSSRLSKLFGVTNIKIDPLVQGITNTPQTRLTLEQQISRQITVTYITNLAQTSEQIFRVEWAFSPQYSVVAIRDDNGEFGIDIQYRRRFR